MSEPPLFLSLDQVFAIHHRSLAEFGGSDGVRDLGLIRSALASAENTFWYGHGDVFDIAAAYAFHLAESQAFLDGNKRTGAGAALTFLKTNDVSCRADDAIYDAIIAIAEKRMDKPGLAVVLQELVEKKI
ncbi:MAG: type II toxin-antitoxin system death-on-curing family toxin [Verrucomicrobia bacterium]|nr:type II toxin-antitoxin system death-on-curing family toxin [Verrucomicrobiota bacterium]